MSLFKRLFGKNKKEEAEVVTQQTVEKDFEEVLETENETKEETKEEFLINQEAQEASQEKEDISIEEDNHVATEDSGEILQEEAPQLETPSETESIEEENQGTIEVKKVEEIKEVQQSTESEEKNQESVLVQDSSGEMLQQTEDEEEQMIEEEEAPQEEVKQEPKKEGFIKRLFSGLSKTRDSILKGVDDVLSNFKHIDEDLYEELEEALIMADFGVDTTLHIMDQLKEKVKQDKITDPVELKPALQAIITQFLTDQPTKDILNPNGPTVVLVIGVNGVGKTTSIGKMSHLFKSQGKKVLVAAADTFRAAAIEQLNVWTERAGVEIIKHEEGSDAAAVVFDAIAAAKSRKSDVLICDTAGRLQNKTNLMKELEKISRIIAREYPEAKKEILIVIDATTGQNALQQVKLFKEVADISGIILTKLDGTAKGGAIVGIYESLKVPVKYIGVGEKIDDLQPFDAEAFAKALFEKEA